MTPIHTLVIACGNSHRGDDGVGPAAADIVSSWQLPGVKVISVHQLVPELIAEMKQVQRVYFIDAAANGGDDGFQSRMIVPKKSSRHFGHHENAASLLALLCDLEHRTPDAWLVSISAVSFDHGAALTDAANKHLHAALGWIRAALATDE